MWLSGAASPVRRGPCVLTAHLLCQFSLHLFACWSLAFPSLLVCIKESDPFCKGCFLHIGRGSYPLYAIQALAAYLAIQGNAEGPLFLLQDGCPLSRVLLTDWLSRSLSASGVQGNFSSHSFPISAATVAARNGVPDHLI